VGLAATGVAAMAAMLAQMERLVELTAVAVAGLRGVVQMLLGLDRLVVQALLLFVMLVLRLQPVEL
jgi:hypothetical protein